MVVAGGASSGSGDPAPTRSSSTTRSGWSPAPSSRSPASRPGRSVDRSVLQGQERTLLTPHAVVTVQVTPERLRPVPLRRLLPVAPAVADRRVLHRLPARADGDRCSSREHDPASAHPSTIPADLLQDIMRLPYRERFTLIINELGAAVGGALGRSPGGARIARCRRSTETDNLLNLLANDSHDAPGADRQLRHGHHRAGQQQRQASSGSSSRPTTTATDTATQQQQPEGRPSSACPGSSSSSGRRMAKLGDRRRPPTRPCSQNLNAASGQLDTLFTNLPRAPRRTLAASAASRASLPAIKSLGQASVTGKQAVQAAAPTVADLNQFAKPTPELAQNLAIVLARPRHPEPRGRARPAQPRRQGLHRARGAARYVVQPDAGDQHLRPVRAHARRRRVRQPDVLAVRDAGDDRR